MSLPPVNIEQIVLRGGLDQITPTLSLAPGFARQALNFEAAVTGGYSRIAGYERVGGAGNPSDLADAGTYRYITVASVTDIPPIEATVYGGTSPYVFGQVIYVDGNKIAVVTTGGTIDWQVGQTMAGDYVLPGGTHGTVGVITDVYTAPVDVEEEAKLKNALVDYYRTFIFRPSGQGAIRGVFEFNDKIYVFRDTLGTPTLLNIQVSDATKTTGWRTIDLLNRVNFTNGSVLPVSDPNYLIQGIVTSAVRATVRQSGSWENGTAVGYMIVDDPDGGNFAAGIASTMEGTVTLTGIQVAQTIQPGGKYFFEEHSFGGANSVSKIYGCDGVNKAFEFTAGEYYLPITTGAAVDTPQCLATHKNFLFLGLGSSIMHSAPGLPHDWTAIGGASELATGATVTGLISMPGGTGSATLGVFNRSNTSILYGTGTSDWNLVTYNTGTGAVLGSLQNMAQTYAFDDRGVNSVQTALQYGNFTQSALTNAILPWIESKIGLVACSTLCRKKSQYRIFFTDGSGLFITVANNKLLGCMPVYFPDVPTCMYEGKKADGSDVIYFGSTDGMVYEMEKGTSFDGDDIPYYLVTNYSNSRSPRTLKRYRKIAAEVSSIVPAYSQMDVSYVLGYGSGEYEASSQATYSTLTGEIRWDSALHWDTFFWDLYSAGVLELAAEGTAENIAILVTGLSDYVSPFTINSFLIHYSPRRLMR